MEIVLRDYQIHAIESVRNSYKKGKTAPLLVMPTGAGKTICFSKIAQSATILNKKVLILVHRSELLNQACAKLTQFGITHGKISPQFKPEYHIPVQVASVDTIIKRLEFIEKPDLIIIDEAHHAIKNNKWGRVIEQFPEAKILGVTATPTRLNGDGLGVHAKGFFDDLIVGTGIQELTNKGYLVPAIYYAPPARIQLEKVKIENGDYSIRELSEQTNLPDITGDAIKHYINISNNLPAIAFCVDRKHAQDVAINFKNAGISSDYIDGSQSFKERQSKIDRLSNGKIKVLTSVNVVSEGTDIPTVTTAIILRKTKSLALHLQMIGRILRPADNKKDAIVIDHVGNVVEHGFANSTHLWSLDTKIKRPSNSEFIMQCPNCYCAFDFRRERFCPSCGHQFETGKSKMTYSSEDLVLLSEQDLSPKVKEIRSAKTVEDLEVLRQKYGYKPGWVFVMKKYLPQHRSFNL
ncbi:MAG: DEAD/DEAH box helicase [Bdellovibrionota bacterium]